MSLRGSLCLKDTAGKLVAEGISPPPPTGDPFYNSTTLLLHMNGANNGVVFTNNSFIARTITPQGNAKTSTAQSVFNGSSGLFDGTTDFLGCQQLAGNDFGSGDFTIEGAVRPVSVAGIQIFLTNRSSGAGDAGFILYMNAGVLSAQIYGPTAGTLALIFAGATLTTGSWQWIALRRSGSTFTLWKNAVSGGSGTYAGSIAASPFNLLFGTDPSTGGRDYNGYAAEWRMTKGVARTIVVPTESWPNSL